MELKSEISDLFEDKVFIPEVESVGSTLPANVEPIADSTGPVRYFRT